MASTFTKGKSDQPRGADQNIDDLAANSANLEANSRLSLDRQTIARITEQKIDEIESAITQDYLKYSRAVTDAAILDQVSIGKEDAAAGGETILQKRPDDPAFEDEFLPTLFRVNDTHLLFNDDLEE